MLSGGSQGSAIREVATSAQHGTRSPFRPTKRNTPPQVWPRPPTERALYEEAVRVTKRIHDGPGAQTNLDEVLAGGRASG